MKKLLSALILLFVMVNAHAQMSISNRQMQMHQNSVRQMNELNRFMTWSMQQRNGYGGYSTVMDKKAYKITTLKADSTSLVAKRIKLEEKPEKNAWKIKSINSIIDKVSLNILKKNKELNTIYVESLSREKEKLIKLKPKTEQKLVELKNKPTSDKNTKKVEQLENQLREIDKRFIEIDKDTESQKRD